MIAQSFGLWTSGPGLQVPASSLHKSVPAKGPDQGPKAKWNSLVLYTQITCLTNANICSILSDREGNRYLMIIQEAHMTLVRWMDPYREFSHLQDRINRVFGDAYGRRQDEGMVSSGTWVPPVDIYQNGDHELVLKAELPDMTREDIDITVDNGTLTIKGEKKFATDISEDSFHRVDRRYGTFSRSFSLPQTVDPAKVAAEYKNGVLTIRLPLREDSKPRQIKVEVAA